MTGRHHADDAPAADLDTIKATLAVHYAEYDSFSQDSDSWKCHCMRYACYRTRAQAEHHVATQIIEALA